MSMLSAATTFALATAELCFGDGEVERSQVEIAAGREDERKLLRRADIGLLASMT